MQAILERALRDYHQKQFFASVEQAYAAFAEGSEALGCDLGRWPGG